MSFEFGRKDRCICGYYGDFLSLGPVLGAHLNISYLVINRRLLEGILDITLSSRKTRDFTAKKALRLSFVVGKLPERRKEKIGICFCESRRLFPIF